MTASPIPAGKSTVTPYVAVKGAARFLDFVRDAFGALERGQVANPDGTIGHAEVRIGDSVLMVFDSFPEWPDTPSFLTVYVDDADSSVERAVAAGAEIVTEVWTSRIIGERGGRVRDPLGNIWWIQTNLEDVDEANLEELFQDPDELAGVRRAQQSFQDEMWRRVAQRTTGTPVNMVTWFQLPANDVQRGWAFYGEVFGWSREASYANHPRLGAVHGELAPRDRELPHPRPVIRVDDLDATLARIERAGGEVLTARSELPEVGMVYATFADTEGNLANVVADLAGPS